MIGTQAHCSACNNGWTVCLCHLPWPLHPMFNGYLYCHNAANNPPSCLVDRNNPGKKKYGGVTHRKATKAHLKARSQMGTGPIDRQQQQELAQLASVVVPLQKLNLEEGETHVTVPRDMPASPKELESQQ